MRSAALIVIAAWACGPDRVTPRDAARVEADATPAYVEAIGATGYLSPELQRAFDPAVDYTPMGAPRPGDWLASFEEPGQTFTEFLDAPTHVPVPGQDKLYILPIGEFPAHAPKLVDLAAVASTFYTLEVRVLPPVALDAVKAKRRLHDGHPQLLAPDVLTWLMDRLPEDGFALMAVTMTDLYPDEDWNFVFGMASLRERVGVQSLARQDPAFFGAAREASSDQIATRRAIWTVVHEIGHMFGLAHCIHYECVFAGSNNQEEADRRPLHACPVCLRKLQSALSFEPAARDDSLAAVLDRLGVADEAAWSRRRAQWIRTGQR